LAALLEAALAEIRQGNDINSALRVIVNRPNERPDCHRLTPDPDVADPRVQFVMLGDVFNRLEACHHVEAPVREPAQVEDAVPLDQELSQEVPVVVLIGDLDVLRPRDAALTGPPNEAIGSMIRQIGLHLRDLQDPER